MDHGINLPNPKAGKTRQQALEKQIRAEQAFIYKSSDIHRVPDSKKAKKGKGKPSKRR